MGELSGLRIISVNQSKGNYRCLYYGVIYTGLWRLQIKLVFLPKPAPLEMKTWLQSKISINIKQFPEKKSLSLYSHLDSNSRSTTKENNFIAF